MPARRGVKLLKLLLIGQAHLDDLWRMLRTRSARIVRRECPAGYTPARTSTVTSSSPAWR
jgi:hypothetical protein